MSADLILSKKSLSDLAAAVSTEFEKRGIVAKLDPVAVSYATAAKLLEVSVRTIENWAEQGILERIYFGQTPRITMQSIQAKQQGHATQKEVRHDSL